MPTAGQVGRIANRVKSYQNEYDKMRTSNIKGTITNVMTVRKRSEQPQSEREGVQKEDQLKEGIQTLRQWGRPLLSIDESKGRPIASQAGDTFDDIALRLTKSGFRLPDNYVSLFQGTTSRQHR